jgi:membrane protease YdiL (CAAX protease family)
MCVGGLLTKAWYLVGLLVILGAAYAQYVVKHLGLIFGYFLVYGIPIIITSWIFGSTIIHKAFKDTYVALKFGLAFYGVFTLLGILASIGVFYLILIFEPNSINLLHKPNPVLHVPPEFAWIMVWISLAVVGPAEEYLFRGYVYGGLLSIFKNRHWLTLAFVSSLLFAAAHLYYVIVYGITSLVIFADLVTFGMAMAAIFYVSGGNLLIPALIHGVYDATGFLGVAVSADLGSSLRLMMTLIGIFAAIGIVLQKLLYRRKATSASEN